MQRIAEVDYVLIVASVTYGQRWEGTNEPTEGPGAAREADALHGLFDADQAEFQRKVKILIMPGLDTDDVVPHDLYRAQRFKLAGLEFDQLEDLLRTLTGQPRYVPPPLGVVPALPPLNAADHRARPAKSLTELLHERDQIRDDLRTAEARLNTLPQPQLGEGPHLPWYRAWEQTASRAATLRAALGPLDALLADLDLAGELRRRNELQEEANEIARRNVAVREAELAPVIQVRVNGRNADADRVEGVLVVLNKHGGVARNLVVETDWGYAPADDEVLASGERTEAKVSKPREAWVRGSDPRPIRYRYEDAIGRTVTRDL